MIIVYRLRNNLFHGEKWEHKLASQASNFTAANRLLANVLELEAGTAVGLSFRVYMPIARLAVYPGETVDIQITFNPSDQGFFTSDLLIGGTGGTSFGGVGVPYEPPVEPTIEGVLDFFDTSVASGTLVGNGPGNSAEGRKNALRNKIEASGDLIRDGQMEEACGQLINAYVYEIQDLAGQCRGRGPGDEFGRSG